MTSTTSIFNNTISNARTRIAESQKGRQSDITKQHSSCIALVHKLGLLNERPTYEKSSLTNIKPYQIEWRGHFVEHHQYNTDCDELRDFLSRDKHPGVDMTVLPTAQTVNRISTTVNVFKETISYKVFYDSSVQGRSGLL